MNNYDLLDEEEDFGFSQCTHALLAAIELSGNAKIVFQFLKSCERSFKPSYASIQAGTGHMGRSTVIRAVKELEKYNLVNITKVDWHGRKKNVYTLKKRDSWLCTFSVKRAGIKESKVVSKMNTKVVSKMNTKVVSKMNTGVVFKMKPLEEQHRKTTKNNNKRLAEPPTKAGLKKTNILKFKRDNLKAEDFNKLRELIRDYCGFNGEKDLRPMNDVITKFIQSPKLKGRAVNFILSEWDTYEEKFFLVRHQSDTKVKAVFLDSIFQRIIKSVAS